MDSEQQEMCMQASRDARALEEMMLNYDLVINLDYQEVEEAKERCRRILECLNECFDHLDEDEDEDDQFDEDDSWFFGGSGMVGDD